MITIDVPGLQSNIGITIDSPALTKWKKQAKKTSGDDRLAKLGLRLMARDDLIDSEKVQLTQDTLRELRRYMGRGESAKVRDFLVKHKDHLFRDLKEMIAEDINAT